MLAIARQELKRRNSIQPSETGLVQAGGFQMSSMSANLQTFNMFQFETFFCLNFRASSAAELGSYMRGCWIAAEQMTGGLNKLNTKSRQSNSEKLGRYLSCQPSGGFGIFMPASVPRFFGLFGLVHLQGLQQPPQIKGFLPEKACKRQEPPRNSDRATLAHFAAPS